MLCIASKVFNRIMLERLRSAVDGSLRDHQAGFRQARSCADQIATLRIIVEQSIEWNSSLYINFVDYQKAFDSLEITSFINIIQKLLRKHHIESYS